MKHSNELIARGFAIVPGVIDPRYIDEIHTVLHATGLDDANGLQWSMLPDPLRELYRSAIEPLVREMAGSSQEFREWQASTILTGHSCDPLPHIDGQGYVRRGGSWDQIPGFRLLVAIPLSDVVTRPNGGMLLGIAGGDRSVRQFFRANAARYFNADGSSKRDQAEACNRHLAFILHDEQQAIGTVPLLGLPGSVTVASSLLPHLVGANDGPARTVLYFRVGRFDPPGLAALS